MLLDLIYAGHIVDLDPDPPVGSLVSQLSVELLELAPWFMVTWVLINLPVLMPARPAVVLNDEVTHVADTAIPDTLISKSLQLTEENASLITAGETPVEQESRQEPGSSAEKHISNNSLNTAGDTLSLIHI